MRSGPLHPGLCLAQKEAQLVRVLQLLIGPFLNSSKNFLLTTEGSNAVMCSLPGPQDSFLRAGSKPFPLQLPKHRLDGPLDSTHRIPPHYHNKKCGKKIPPPGMWSQGQRFLCRSDFYSLFNWLFQAACSINHSAPFLPKPEFSKTSKFLQPSQQPQPLGRRRGGQ